MKIRATTILTVRREDSVAIGGDGQVTLDSSVMKADALKIRKTADGKVITDVTRADTEVPRAAGSDQVEFQVALNPGQPARPLRKIASGGELSRISLAVQVVSKNQEGTPTFIFDEVDAGIGGGVAEIVGGLLHGLADRHQVLCVTHLPQVASQGDHHMKIEKSADKNATRTFVTNLSNKARVEEIARMLGGMTISEKTRAHACEMLNQQVKSVKS